MWAVGSSGVRPEYHTRKLINFPSIKNIIANVSATAVFQELYMCSEINEPIKK